MITSGQPTTTRRICLLAWAALASAGCSAQESAPSWPEPPDLGGSVRSTIVDLSNARGESLFAILAEPAAPGPFPAVVVLHGSGGLYRLPGPTEETTCSPELESQFERWAKRLVGLGFAVLMPDSFTPRGYCDDNDDPRRAEAFPPIDGDEDGNTRRLLARIYDVDSAVRFLVGREGIRADAMAMLGFSNGASTTALYSHHVLSEALEEFATTPDGVALGVDIPALPGPVPLLQQAIAYYPGCGFDGILPFSTDAEDSDTFFYPALPLRIEHAERDALVAHCSITNVGTRERQADAYAQLTGSADHYDIVVHPGADHGFDAAGCETAATGADADTLACRDALATTLELLEPLRGP